MSKKPAKKEKNLTTDEMLYSIDTANRMLAYDIERLNKKLEDHLTDIAKELKHQNWRITDLNETVYEDRHIIADFVRRFMKDSRDFLDPNIAIDGGPKKPFPENIADVKQPIKNRLKND